ncbi:hypothetical protein JCGZ_18116 [Jatropha curcas]|uniref:Aminotransferase-like plant mobile domain-containing protein n=1 Tax=Jatropha curcas TaxID=180498 RepID=A0A067KD43_JATCU|nr:hypothetical protein JCGZ_18116 [Jatropha curcas]
MRCALMDRWNDCTHSFIFGFGEMTLTPVDYTTITGLGFDGPVAPLDARYQTAALGVELVRTLLGVPTRTRYIAQGYVSYEVVYRFWVEWIRSRLAAWRELPADARPAAPAYMREERDQTASPAVLVCLRDLGRVGSYDWASLALAHLYHGLDVWAYEYRIYPGGPRGDAAADGRWIPRYLAQCHHTFSSSEDPHYWRCYLNDRTLADLLLTPWEGDAWEAYPARAVVLTAQRRVPDAPPHHMCLLEGMTPKDLLEEYDGSPADVHLTAGDYTSYFTTRLQARLPEVREYIQERRRHQTPAYYKAQAEAEAEAAAQVGPTGAVLGDVPFPPGMEVPAQRYQELYQTFGFPRSYIARLYPKLHERDLEIGRLEVEGIPLDFSEDKEDDDDSSSSDNALPSPPSQAAAGSSRRRR